MGGPSVRSLGLALAITLSLLAASCLSSAADPVGPASVPIDTSVRLDYDGASLFLQVRGADRRAPILLWLHGGPGGAERPLFRLFNGELEDRFVVVYWDQRGAGRSFDPDADPSQLTISRHLADMDFVVDHLRRDLHRERIALLGHSWGAALGLLYAHAHPEKVCALIGVNPLVSAHEAQRAQYDFVSREARCRSDDDVLRRAQEIGAPPFETAREVLAMQKLVERYGGVFHETPNRVWIAIRGIFRGLVTPWEIPRLIRANELSLDAMLEELLRLDLARSVPRVEVPVTFFLGRHDRQTDPTSAIRYLAALHAPTKGRLWFERSAHNIPFEEPHRFNASVVRELFGKGRGRSEAPVRSCYDVRFRRNRERRSR